MGLFRDWDEVPPEFLSEEFDINKHALVELPDMELTGDALKSRKRRAEQKKEGYHMAALDKILEGGTKPIQEEDEPTLQYHLDQLKTHKGLEGEYEQDIIMARLGFLTDDGIEDPRIRYAWKLHEASKQPSREEREDQYWVAPPKETGPKYSSEGYVAPIPRPRTKAEADALRTAEMRRAHDFFESVQSLRHDN